MAGLFSNHKFSRSIILIAVALFYLPLGFAQSHPDAKDLLKQMTLEEKVAQLSQLPGFPIREFKEQDGDPKDVLRKYGAGSVLC